MLSKKVFAADPRHLLRAALIRPWATTPLLVIHERQATRPSHAEVEVITRPSLPPRSTDDVQWASCRVFQSR